MTREHFARMKTQAVYKPAVSFIADGCFGTSDLIQLELMARELARRGK